MKDVNTNQITFGSVPLPVLDVVWPDVVKLMDKTVATAKGKFTIDDLRRAIESGDLALWMVLDGAKPIAAITTRVITYPQRKAMALDWVGGSRMAEWFDIAMPTLMSFARANGCAHMEGYGRKAWLRWIGRYGWEPEYIAFRKELDDGK